MYEDFAKEVISAFGPRRGELTEGATPVAEHEKPPLEIRTTGLPRRIGWFGEKQRKKVVAHNSTYLDFAEGGGLSLSPT